jgi:PAS domain S-box-containing protein
MLASFGENEIPTQLRLGVELIASQVAAAFARIQAEESLRRSEAQLRKIIQNAPVALLGFDEKGVITFEDGQALSAMGTKPAQHVGRSAVDVYSDFPLMVENVRRALKAEEFSSIIRFGDNVLECRFAPVRYRDATRPGFVAVATNITERFRLEKQILEISDREQARIGQDVHDGLCQQLVGAAFTANSLQQSLTAQARTEAVDARKICSLLDDAITESRRVARGLYPVLLKTEGLWPALVELARIATERFGIQCACMGSPEALKHDTTTDTHLYRIVQEAVNNAVKHSGARKISIRLTTGHTGVDMEVKDDGKGIMSAGQPRSGMGLYIMDYRARSIGAELRITSDTRGTLVSCRLPQEIR